LAKILNSPYYRRKNLTTKVDLILISLLFSKSV
jgi:hypothetical protein